MATVAEAYAHGARDFPRDRSLEWAVDRWIYVFMAAWFIFIVLNGFIPSSLAKIAAVQSGERPPFPMVLHMHAALMGSFLVLLLCQTWLAAIGRCDLHRRLGIAALLLVPAIVLVGFVLVPTLYHASWNAIQTAPADDAEQMRQGLRIRDNIMLLQLRIGILFPLFMAIGFRARRGNSGLHKRMMFLATAMALPAGIDRIPWLPHSMPASPVTPDLYTLLAVLPLFLWDVLRNRNIHRAWLIWIGVNIPFAVALHGLWDSDWWHNVAPRIMGI
ncbi:MAG TPA: hypothetical protein VFO69_11275 [Allosphingosinicella sp.]|nr:hypothetical protein [Allosphingosinicella sp.]